MLLPVDEAASRPDFFAFRARLLTAIARHDAARVRAIVDPDIKNGFGGEEGSRSFEEMWRPDAPDSRLWEELGRTLALGGTFEGPDTFEAPYVFSRWPQQYDAFEHVAVIGSDVRVRAAARSDAEVLTTLSFSILRVARPETGSGAWTAIQLPDGRAGYVAAECVRSPVAYRAIFTRAGSGWRLAMFLQGD